MNSTTLTHQAERRKGAFSLVVVVAAALTVFSATGRADVCDDFLAALAMQDGALQALTQHSRQERRPKTVNETGKSFIESYMAAGDAVDASARAVALAVRGKAASTVDALLALADAHQAALRAGMAWKETLSERSQRDLLGVLGTVAEAQAEAYGAYLESLKIFCQH